MHTCVCTYAHISTYINLHTHTHRHRHGHRHRHRHNCSLSLSHTYTHVHVYKHTYINIHKQKVLITKKTVTFGTLDVSCIIGGKKKSKAFCSSWFCHVVNCSNLLCNLIMRKTKYEFVTTQQSKNIRAWCTSWLCPVVKCSHLLGDLFLIHDSQHEFAMTNREKKATERKQEDKRYCGFFCFGLTTQHMSL